MRSPTWQQTILAFSCIFCAALAGCTVTYDDPKPVTLNPVNKINIAVELRLTDALRQSKHEMPPNMEGDRFIQPLGNALSADSEATARTVFQNVQISNGGTPSAPASLQNVDAVLIPALASVDRDRPLVTFDDQTTTIQLTWTLLDRNGKILWGTTVAGEGKGPMGSPYSKDSGKENMANALQDVFAKSVTAIASAPLIRQYAARISKTTTP